MGMGLGYIPSGQYESWAKLNRVKIGPAELAVLKSLDRAYVAFQNDKSSDKKPQHEATPENLAGAFRSVAGPGRRKRKGG